MEKYPAVGCVKGYFVDTASTRVPRGKVCLFSGFGTPTRPDRTMSAFLVDVADSIDELRQRNPSAFHPPRQVAVERDRYGYPILRYELQLPDESAATREP